MPIPRRRGMPHASIVLLSRLFLPVALGCTLALPARGQTSDVTPPVVQSFSFSPSTIDVTGGPGSVTVALRLTDDIAGVGTTAQVVVTFTAPNGVTQFTRPSRVSGTALDGIYVGTLIIPQFSPSGTWTVTSIRPFDLAGNVSTITADVLASRGFPNQLSVISITDDQPPSVSGIAFTPNAIDVSTDDQAVAIDFQATDNLSGIALTSCAPNPTPLQGFVVTLRSPSGAQNRFAAASGFTLIAGTRTNGVWRSILTMPRYSEPGAWKVQAVSLRDCANNQTNLSESQITSAGLQATLNVSSNPADVQPPTLTSLAFLPITINTSTGFQFLTVRMGISDNLSGADVSPTTPSATFFERGVNFRSPSGIQSRAAATFATFNLISGTPLNGVWETTILFPQFSEEGTWKIDLLTIKDRTRNTVSFDRAGLQALGFPTTLDVIKPSLITDGTVGQNGGQVSDQTFGERATVFFPAGALSGPTAVAIDVLAKPLDVPNPTGFSGPGSLYVNIHLTPQPNFPLAPPGLTVVLPLRNLMISGTLLKLFKVDTLTGGLIPAINVFGKDVLGSVNADGLSATFQGIASLSTVVGLIPEALNVGIDIKPGDSPNTINLKSKGVLPAAILSSETFDASTVRLETVRLSGASVRLKGNGQPAASFEDVNGDGRLDLVLQFDTQALELTSNDTEAKLTGLTKDGLLIAGRDGIRFTP